jgi:cytochrome c oxidase cbb3-type subunit 3
MMRRFSIRSTLAALLVAAPVAANGGQNATATADIEQGKAIFAGACVVCHGVAGGGAMAPPLDRPTLVSAPDDASLQRVIREGIPERGMPRVRRFTDNELGQLTAYIRSLTRTTAPITGNAGAGAAVYDKMGCAACHIVRGQGGSFGPQLTNIGLARGPAYLRQAIVEPAAALPRSAVMGLRGYDEYLPVQVVTPDGRKVRGVRVNEDAFTLQIREPSGALHSFRKADVRSISKEQGASLMPSYRARLSDTELDDLVAYLASIGGAQ